MSEDINYHTNNSTSNKPNKLRKKKKDKKIEQFQRLGKYSSRGQREKEKTFNDANKGLNNT